eukprot:gene1327-biopygen13838
MCELLSRIFWRSRQHNIMFSCKADISYCRTTRRGAAPRRAAPCRAVTRHAAAQRRAGRICV